MQQAKQGSKAVSSFTMCSEKGLAGSMLSRAKGLTMPKPFRTFLAVDIKTGDVTLNRNPIPVIGTEQDCIMFSDVAL